MSFETFTRAPCGEALKYVLTYIGHMEIGIVGGAGHVGLPLGLVLADAGHHVTLVDQDEQRLSTISDGYLPYREPGGQAYLETALERDRLETSPELADVAGCDAVFIAIGTPIDKHRNPDIDGLLDVVTELATRVEGHELVILRSTVYPGTTEAVAETLEDSGHTVGEDIFLSVAPERVAQHSAIEELVTLPQLVGTFDEESYNRTVAVFETFLETTCLSLTPTEAELAKLFTNVWRYLTFAAANEFYLIAESFNTHHEVNVHRILDAAGYEYPRFDVPSPGANVGGPCLTKDGWFLVDNIPYNELVSVSYQINEGMPAQIVETMARKQPDPDGITILGMSYKRNSDDVRNSVAFRLRKHLVRNGYRSIVEIEPNVEGFDDWEQMHGSDWVILMTPHEEFRNLADISEAVDNDDCLYADLWGFWETMRYQSDNGYFFGRDIEECSQTGAFNHEHSCHWQ